MKIKTGNKNTQSSLKTQRKMWRQDALLKQNPHSQPLMVHKSVPGTEFLDSYWEGL